MPSRKFNSKGNKRQFCSRACQITGMRKFWNSPVERKKRSERAIGEKNGRWNGGLLKCIDCGKTLSLRKGLTRCLKCNGKITSKIRVGKKAFNWQGGKSIEPYSINWTSQLKDRIRVRDNFKCQICGVPELECNRKLDVHHIDYDKKNCKESNLIALCRSCHTKTSGKNREYWIDRFQKEGHCSVEIKEIG